MEMFGLSETFCPFLEDHFSIVLYLHGERSHLVRSICDEPSDSPRFWAGEFFGLTEAFEEYMDLLFAEVRMRSAYPADFRFDLIRPSPSSNVLGMLGAWVQ